MSQYFRNAHQRSLRNKLKPNTEDAMLMGTAKSKAYAANQVGQDYKNLTLPLTDEQKARDELKDFGGRRRHTEDAMLMGIAKSKAYAANQVGQDYENLTLPLTDEQKARDELKDFGGRRRHKKTNFRKKRRNVRYTRKRCKKRR